MQAVIVAVDLSDADRYARANGIGRRDYVACTVRSPHRVRGYTAEALHTTPRADELPDVGRLLDEARPCLLT